jgi:hypothetical protein
MKVDPLPSDWKLPRLRIDRSGDWFDDDVEITHPGILANLRQNLRHDADGYFIQTRVRIPVEVEDRPWVVTRLERRGERLHGILNDGTETMLDPGSVRIDANDVPYAPVKDSRFEARFSQAAAFQLLALVEPDPATGHDTLRLGGHAYVLRRSA